MDYSFFAPPTAQPYGFFSLPEKPTHTYTPPTEIQHDPLDAFHDPSAFQFFDQNADFDASAFIPTNQPPVQPPKSEQPNPTPITYDRSPSIVNEASFDTEYGNQNLERSSDDDKESLTPAQSRRKAQNRAAQRAFRERKEKHVKELEVKLKSIESRSSDLLTDNERLRRELDRLQTQNEILRATSTPTNLRRSSHSHPPLAPHRNLPDPKNVEVGPMIYNPKSFDAAFSPHSPSSEEASISHQITVSPLTGERLLATGAAWDLIHRHEAVNRGDVDLGMVVERLREKTVCNGNGPTFPEGEILKAVEEARGVPGDELI